MGNTDPAGNDPDPTVSTGFGVSFWSCALAGIGPDIWTPEDQYTPSCFFGQQFNYPKCDEQGGVPVCPEGEVLVDGLCEIVCPEGEVLVDGLCEIVCLDGEVLVDGLCKIPEDLPPVDDESVDCEENSTNSGRGTKVGGVKSPSPLCAKMTKDSKMTKQRKLN